MADPVIKTCPFCGAAFTARDLLENPEIWPRGMQFLGEGHDYNSYYFDHRVPGCGTTFCVGVLELSELIDGPIPDGVGLGSDECEGYCGDLESSEICGNDCRYAPFRKLLVEMRSRRRAGDSTEGK